MNSKSKYNIIQFDDPLYTRILIQISDNDNNQSIIISDLPPNKKISFNAIQNNISSEPTELNYACKDNLGQFIIFMSKKWNFMNPDIVNQIKLFIIHDFMLDQIPVDTISIDNRTLRENQRILIQMVNIQHFSQTALSPIILNNFSNEIELKVDIETFEARNIGRGTIFYWKFIAENSSIIFGMRIPTPNVTSILLALSGVHEYQFQILLQLMARHILMFLLEELMIFNYLIMDMMHFHLHYF